MNTVELCFTIHHFYYLWFFYNGLHLLHIVLIQSCMLSVDLRTNLQNIVKIMLVLKSGVVDSSTSSIALLALDIQFCFLLDKQVFMFSVLLFILLTVSLYFFTQFLCYSYSYLKLKTFLPVFSQFWMMNIHFYRLFKS